MIQLMKRLREMMANSVQVSSVRPNFGARKLV